MSIEMQLLSVFAIGVAFLVIFVLALELASWILRLRTYRERVKARDCRVCRKRSTMECPNSYYCYSTEDKPYFEEKGGIADGDADETDGSAS